MTPPDYSDVDLLVNELRARVAERREAGAYPDGLEEELDAHFKHIVAHRRAADLADLRKSLELLDRRGVFGRERIGLDTGIPGGRQAHTVIGKAVSRQTTGILQQVQEWTVVAQEALNKIADALEGGYGHVHPDLVGQLDAIWERLAAWERGPVDSALAVADLRRRVEALEAREQGRQFHPSYTADDFETAFRGSGDELKDRYQDVAAAFVDHGPVLDIGCGRGEFIELLLGLGIEAGGVEIDHQLVVEGRALGFEIAQGDGVRHLAALPDRSLGGIVLLQVVEHLSPQGVIDLAAIARHKLRDGGMILIETVNPQSLYTFAHSFYVDPTHGNPVHPAYLTFLFKHAGWREVEIMWRSPPPEGDVLEIEDGISDAAAANIKRLNQLLFAPQDYALVAYR